MAERLGFTHDEALTLGRAVAGLNAYSKGVSLGLIHPAPAAVREQRNAFHALVVGARGLVEDVRDVDDVRDGATAKEIYR